MTRTKLTRLVTANGKRVALTEKQYQVLKAMRTIKQWSGPTQIGESCGQTYDTASSWAGPALRRLVDLGVVERGEVTPNKGKYRLIRAATYVRK
jgi:predicted transcriptional regulator